MIVLRLNQIEPAYPCLVGLGMLLGSLAFLFFSLLEAVRSPWMSSGTLLLLGHPLHSGRSCFPPLDVPVSCRKWAGSNLTLLHCQRGLSNFFVPRRFPPLPFLPLDVGKKDLFFWIGSLPFFRGLGPTSPAAGLVPLRLRGKDETSQLLLQRPCFPSRS